MRIEIPNFVQFNVLHANLPVIVREANEDFFKDIHNATQYIFKNYCNETYELYNKQKDIYTEKTYTKVQMITQINKAIDIITKSIQNKKYFPCLVKDYNADINYKSLFKNMDVITEEKYKTELNQLIQIHKENMNQRQQFIIDNKDKIISFLSLIRDEYLINIKQAKSEYQKKYSESIKCVLPPRELLTDEQKILNRKETQKKYSESIKQIIPSRELLTEEQRKANRRETQKKYREKYKTAAIDKSQTTLTEPPPPREVLTEEQRLINRKACNRQYYLKRKDKRQKTTDLKTNEVNILHSQKYAKI
jgi:hypothetical protein